MLSSRMTMLTSGLPDQVADDEDLARFLTQSNQYSSQHQIPKPAAFLPNPKDQETSVFRHGENPAAGLWALGEQAVGGRKLYGAAIFKAYVARSVQLEVEPDEPPLRHAVVRRWPWLEHDQGLQKARQIEMAAVIASSARLLLKGPQ